MRVKKNYKSVSAFADALKKELQTISSSKVFREIAEKARDIIYKRVKSGYGVQGGSKEKLQALSEDYIAYRKGQTTYETKSKGKKVTRNSSARIKLGKFGSPTKSNLTLTGHLLENIEIKFTRNGATLYFPNKKHPIHNINIRDLAEYVQENGRPFFDLTRDERQILIRELTLQIRKIAGSL